MIHISMFSNFSLSLPIKNLFVHFLITDQPLKRKSSGIMFLFKKKKTEKDAQKLKLVEDTQQAWGKFGNVHSKIHSLKLSLKSLRNVEEDIKLQKMPPIQYKYFKLKGTLKMAEVLKSNITIFKEDSLFIQHSIGIVEEKFGVEKKIFEVPNIDDGLAPKSKCKQFELLLDSFEEQITILEKEKERKEKSQDQNKSADVSPKNDENVDDCSFKDKVEEMSTLSWRLSIFFQDLFTLENGLSAFEDDNIDIRMKSFDPEEPDILELLVKDGLHVKYIQIKIKIVLGIIERLKNQMKRSQIKEHFQAVETQSEECPKFSSENSRESISSSFRYIYEEILSLKYDFEKLLDHIENDE